MCRVLQLSPGGYYDWRRRPRSDRAAGIDALVISIRAIRGEVRARSGSQRIYAELVAWGEPRCVNTVARLMHRSVISAKTKRKICCTTNSNHGRPAAENLLGRQFDPEAANRVWTAEITSIATGEGWLYLAAVEDLHSRRIVGWSMGDRFESRLIVDALEMAVSRRRPSGGRWLIRTGAADTPASFIEGHWPAIKSSAA